eukprot:scaffold15099_cov358-Ochromonas_danica.AAC.1
MEQIRFADFHAKMVAKLQPAMTADASSAAALGSSAKENNIFRQLMQRIKNLEMNFVIAEMYINQ